MPHTPYTRQWSSATPGIIIILIDQSGSMQESFAVSQSKAQAAAEAVNWTIDSLIMLNIAGEKVKDRCYITLISYGHEVGKCQELKSSPLSSFAEHPLRKEKRQLSQSGEPYLLGIHLDAPMNGADTPMDKAFEKAKDVLALVLTQKPNSPAPVIINISDGMPNNEGAVRSVVENIKKLKFEDGAPLVYNIHLPAMGQGKENIVFPNKRAQLRNANAQFLYDISSEIPVNCLSIAKEVGLLENHESGHRGLIFDANGSHLIKMLSFGTSTKTKVNHQPIHSVDSSYNERMSDQEK